MYKDNNRTGNSQRPTQRLNMPVTDGVGGNHGCGCVSCCGSTWGLQEYPLASVYSPCQEWRNLYSPTNALLKGTLFSELDLPFAGKNCVGGKGCRG